MRFRSIVGKWIYKIASKSEPRVLDYLALKAVEGDYDTLLSKTAACQYLDITTQLFDKMINMGYLSAGRYVRSEGDTYWTPLELSIACDRFERTAFRISGADASARRPRLPEWSRPEISHPLVGV